MEGLRKIIARFSLLVAVITFITCIISGISLPTSIVRSVEAYLAMILVFVIVLKLLRWGLVATSPPVPSNEEVDKADEEKGE